MELTKTHIAQALSYLAISGLQVALIFNFRNASIQFKRVVNNITPNIEPANRTPFLNHPEDTTSQNLNP